MIVMKDRRVIETELTDRVLDDSRNAQIVMQSLRDINQNDSITVITNLHTLDTARSFCERIVAGKVVFDGGSNDLTEAAARRIYGADGLEDAFSEAVTSTSFAAPKKPKKKTLESIGLTTARPAETKIQAASSRA